MNSMKRRFAGRIAVAIAGLVLVVPPALAGDDMGMSGLTGGVTGFFGMVVESIGVVAFYFLTVFIRAAIRPSHPGISGWLRAMLLSGVVLVASWYGLESWGEHVTRQSLQAK